MVILACKTPCACAIKGASPSYLSRQQFRRAGLLVWPRSKRLLNAVHGDLAQQTLRLHSMLVGGAQGWGRCKGVHDC